MLSEGIAHRDLFVSWKWTEFCPPLATSSLAWGCVVEIWVQAFPRGNSREKCPPKEQERLRLLHPQESSAHSGAWSAQLHPALLWITWGCGQDSIHFLLLLIEKLVHFFFFKIFFEGANLVTRNRPEAVWLKHCRRQPKAQSPRPKALHSPCSGKGWQRESTVSRVVTWPGSCCSHRSGLSARSVLCLLSGISALKNDFWGFVLRIKFCFLKYCSSDLSGSSKFISARYCWGHVKPYFWFCLWIRAGFCSIFKKIILCEI